MCFLRLILNANLALHVLQTYGFSPVWIRLELGWLHNIVLKATIKKNKPILKSNL